MPFALTPAWRWELGSLEKFDFLSKKCFLNYFALPLILLKCYLASVSEQFTAIGILILVGGCYFEDCIDPEMHELYGSGLRVAAALPNKDFQIELISCIGNRELETARSICDTFGVLLIFTQIEETIFEYYHPLGRRDAIVLQAKMKPPW